MLRMFCKEGKLEVSDDRMLRVVKLFGGALVWQVSVPMIENMLASPGSIGTFNVTFETSQGRFIANTISQPNYLKLQSALGLNGIVQQKEAPIKTKKPKHWYEPRHGRAFWRSGLQGLRAAGQEAPAGALLRPDRGCADQPTFLIRPPDRRPSLQRPLPAASI